MTAGQFIKLEILHENFGAERVYQTARRLREAGYYAKGRAKNLKGTKEDDIDPIMIANLLFALFATSSPVYAIRALDRAGLIIGPAPKNSAKNIISFIARVIYDSETRNAIDYMLISQKNGHSVVYMNPDMQLPGIRSGHKDHHFSDGSHEDYDNFEFDGESIDSVTKVTNRFFELLIDEMEQEKK